MDVISCFLFVAAGFGPHMRNIGRLASPTKDAHTHYFAVAMNARRYARDNRHACHLAHGRYLQEQIVQDTSVGYLEWAIPQLRSRREPDVAAKKK